MASGDFRSRSGTTGFSLNWERPPRIADDEYSRLSSFTSTMSPSRRAYARTSERGSGAAFPEADSDSDTNMTDAMDDQGGVPVGPYLDLDGNLDRGANGQQRVGSRESGVPRDAADEHAGATHLDSGLILSSGRGSLASSRNYYVRHSDVSSPWNIHGLSDTYSDDLSDDLSNDVRYDLDLLIRETFPGQSHEHHSYIRDILYSRDGGLGANDHFPTSVMHGTSTN